MSQKLHVEGSPEAVPGAVCWARLSLNCTPKLGQVDVSGAYISSDTRPD